MTLPHHLRFAIRAIAKSRTVSVVAISTFALGVGLNTAIFSVLESVVLKQLPYPAADRLVTIDRTDGGGRRAEPTDVWTLQQWRDRGHAIEAAAMYGDAQATFSENGESEVWRGMRVSWQFFEVLGARAWLGRTFARDEDQIPHERSVILSHDLWSRRFGSDPSVVERGVQFNGRPARIVGVLPPDFHPIHMSNPAEVPQYFTQAEYDLSEANACHACSRSGRIIARLRPSVTVNAASKELTDIDRDLANLYPTDGWQYPIVVAESLFARLVGPIRRSLWLLFGAVIVVTLIACTNVAGLQLTRAVARQREFAIRGALGGSRTRLITQLLTEHLLIAVIGGATGAGAAPVMVGLLVHWAPRELPRLEDVHVDGVVLAFALGTTLVSGFIFGIIPALSASRFDLNDMLKRTSTLTGRGSSGRLRNGIVVVATALAFTLVLGAALIGRSVANLQRLDAGFDSHNVLTLTLDGSYASARQRMIYLRGVVERVLAIPGIEGTGTVSNVPLSHIEPWPYRIDSEPSSAATVSRTADVFWVSPGYCKTLRIPLLRGRDLEERDGEPNGRHAALISETFARVQFKGVDPIGHRIRIGPEDPELIIVGVVGDVRYAGLDRAPGAAVYAPQGVNVTHYTRLVARTTGDPMRYEPAVRAAIHDLDPSQPIFHAQPMDAYVASSLAERRFALALIALFGFVALVLATTGTYGVISHSVTQRTPEIGIRIALGGTREHVVSLVLRQAVALTLVGVLLGAGFAFGAAQFLRRLLFGVTPLDLTTFVATAGALLMATLFAASLPAWVATRIEPLRALRAE